MVSLLSGATGGNETGPTRNVGSRKLDKRSIVTSVRSRLTSLKCRSELADRRLGERERRRLFPRGITACAGQSL